MLTGRPGRVVVLGVLLALACGLGTRARAAADDSTPSPVAAAPSVTPMPTVIIVTDTPAPEPTLAPTPIPERPQHLPTNTPVPPTSAAVPVDTEAPTWTPLPVSTAVDTPTPIAPSSVPVATTSISSDPWPSPAELELNARLRWGHGIPASVRRWAFLIVPAARKYHLDPNLIAAVMTMESNGDPLAESPADARGLMQILHGPWDPKENVYEGARMLAELYGQFGDWSLTLAAYNAGPGAVQAYGGIPPLRETRDYVIIVGYLWDLYSHHHITMQRKTLYRSTLKDLQHFADQRKKVKLLAHVAHVPYVPADLCGAESCGGSTPNTATLTVDPFWPDTSVPDPLQRVDPYPSAKTSPTATSKAVITSGEQ